MTRRALAVAIVALPAWAAIAYVTGGFATTALGFAISLRSPVRPLLVAALLLCGGLVAFGWRSLIAELEWLACALRTAVASVHRGELLVVVFVFAGIVASYSDFIPYWDAKI